MTTEDFEIVRLHDLDPVECPCGFSRRAFLGHGERTVTLHEVDIQQSARSHYHKRLTEIYYVLDGEGEIELNGRRHPLHVGDAVLIKPGCRHRALGKLRILNVVVPAYDPDDEWFDGP
jgi:mannose-6-phosphate isomerase-like protein (cupin superfamily)